MPQVTNIKKYYLGNCFFLSGLDPKCLVAGLLLLISSLCTYAASAETEQKEKGEENSRKISKVGAPGKGESKIVSDTVDIDFKNHVAIFKGNVKVYDKKQTLESDEMKVFFTKKNELKKVIAVGDVVINQPEQNRQAESGRAEYNVSTGKIRLTEDPTLQMGDSTIKNAAVIIYNRDTQRVTTKGQRPEVQFYSDDGEGAIFPEEEDDDDGNEGQQGE